MPVSATIHGVTRAEAKQANCHAWLVLSDEKGQDIAAFMPYAQAKAMADAFSAAFVDGGEDD